MPTPHPVSVRTATSRDRLEVRRILDGAMLEIGDVEARIDADDVFVATRGRGREREQDRKSDTERILGALVCEPREREREHGRGSHAHISAIAVRRRQRARGIGTALVEHALEREGALTARFDESVRPFYDSLDFSITRIDDRRYEGERRRSE